MSNSKVKQFKHGNKVYTAVHGSRCAGCAFWHRPDVKHSTCMSDSELREEQAAGLDCANDGTQYFEETSNEAAI